MALTHFWSRRRAALAVALTLVMLFGCDRPPVAPPTPRPIVVFATLYPLADIARQVGGEFVRVDWLLDLGDPIDHYTINRPDRERITAADLVLCDSVGRTETWAQQELGLLQDVGKVVSADVLPAARDAAAEGLLYTDPQVAEQYAAALADAFGRHQPADAAAFRANAKTFADAVTAAVAGFHAPAAKVLVLSGDLAPLLARLGVHSVAVDADPLAFTGPDAVAVKKAARAAGVHAMLVPFDTPPGTLAFLEEQTGLRVFPVDRLGYPNYAGHASYLDLLRYDLDELKLATAQ